MKCSGWRFAAALEAVLAGVGALALVMAMAPRAAASPSMTRLSGSASGLKTQATQASYNGLALTPPMGFNDWNAFGCNVSAQLIEQTADAMVANGMKAAGYQYVNIDDCWMAGHRDANGNLVPDPAKFPDGIKAVADYVHSLGLKFGIYEEAGTKTCAGYPGSYGHYQQDADQFASWGVDYLKFDWCYVPYGDFPGKTANQVNEILVQEMSQALRATGRPIVYSNEATVNNTGPDMMSWIGTYSNLWRTTSDIQPNWPSMMYNFTHNVQLYPYAHPGAWNDPDMLEVGNGGMTDTEYRSEFSLWSEMAAPLIAGTDLRNASPATLAIYENRDVIAVDQDPLGKQGRVVSSSNGHWVLTKPLANGDVAVALFNETDAPATISTTASQAGLGKAAAYTLRDLWQHTTSETAGVITASVPAHGTVMYRVSPSTPASAPPAVDVSISAPPLAYAGQTLSVSETFTNNGRLPVTDLSLTAEPPSTGWAVQAASATTFNVVESGQTVRATWHLTAPSTLPPPGTSLQASTRATYSWPGGQPANVQKATTLVVPSAPYPTLAAAFNNVGITNESDPTAGNFDGGGNTYSAQALAAQGLTPGAPIAFNGFGFTWPDVPAGTPDNVAGGARTITLTGNGTTLAFLGAEDNYSTDTAVVTYTDGTEQQFSLTFPNWCCEGGPPFADGAQVVATMTHRDTPSGPGNYGVDWWVFYQSVALLPGKTVKEVTLPADPHVHVFALSVG